MLSEKETSWYWVDNKAVRSNEKRKSKSLISKYIFSDNTIELHEVNGNEVDKMTNNYKLSVEKSQFVITDLDGNISTWVIKGFDGKKMTIRNPDPTKESDFNHSVGGDPPLYLQLEFELSK